MRKIFFLLLLLTVSVSQAQKNKQAIKVTDELSEVMNLSADEKEKVLALNIEKFQKISALRKKHGKDKESFTEEAKPIHQEFNKNLRKLVGKEKMKLLRDYREKNKLKKKEN